MLEILFLFAQSSNLTASTVILVCSKWGAPSTSLSASKQLEAPTLPLVTGKKSKVVSSDQTALSTI